MMPLVVLTVAVAVSHTGGRMYATQNLSLIALASLIVIACQGADTVARDDLGQVSQELSLGSSLGTPVISGTTCGLNNGIAPTCAPSNASDISHTWTPPSSGTFTFNTTGSDFDTVLLLAPFSAPFSPLGCNASGNSSSLRMRLFAGQQYIVTIDGFAAECGDYQLNISQNCSDTSCTHPPPCSVSPGTCNNSGTCSYTSLCGADEICRAGTCVARCLIDPRFPC
jgi:hypothetical protein